MHKPSPPVPQKLREMLKDYPEHIARLQEALDSYVQKPIRSLPFDGAIWALEGRLETFIAEAREEVKAAEADGDTEKLTRAKAKKFAFGATRADMGSMTELRNYFRSGGAK